MYGGGKDASTSSYMLQYRKCDGSKMPMVEPEMIPDYLRNEIESEHENLIFELKEKKEDLLKMQVKVYEPGEERGEFKTIKAKKSDGFGELI